MKKIFLLLSLLALNSFATEMFLVQATNDEDDEISKLYLVLDENADIKKFTKKTLSSSKSLLKEESFELDGERPRVVIDHRQDRDILVLESSNFTEHQGGDISLVYLINGITGSTGELELDLSRHGDEWELAYRGQPVSHLHLVSNRKFMVGTIGVKQIRIIK